MTRSFSLLLCALSSVVLAPAVYADLDELLGDWASAASQEIDQDSSSEVELSPASSSDVSTPESTGSTLTGIHGHSAGEPTSVIHPEAIDEMYSVVTPTMNPHYVPDSCGCGDANCEGAPHTAHQCRSNGCHSCGDGCGALISRAESGCIEGQSECRPHQRPNLPSSTFLELFRSRNSYSNVWAGYAEETRLRVRNRSPHLDGTWRCNGCGALLEPNQVGCGCGGGCDHQ
ncbi:hypothetical protein [Neorhodopirellula pilleata]|uniref:Uncharacterized protein n=1 Tax=Neorhodopirellula pilleata TaxID=2714738 RepID=A0A5C6ADB2_9BACT|nr:hypothetical protein [Neorhodopirellula pilleata]TWT97397.1 hypothetical protein Pla100_25490 [Neorhodopirellula pilleata]